MLCRHHAGGASRLNKLVEKVCSVIELSRAWRAWRPWRQTSSVDSKTGIYLMPSNLYNMCLQSYKVHLVPSSSARGVPGAASSYNHLCQSSCTALTAAMSPASAREEDAEAQQPTMSLYAALGHFPLFCPFPLTEKQKKTLPYCKYKVHSGCTYCISKQDSTLLA